MAAKGGYNPGSVNVTVVAGQTTTANIHLSYLAANNPPNPPSLVFPPDGSINQATTLTLSWSCSDPDGDPFTYDVYFGETASLSTIVSSNQSGTALLRSGLDTSTTYYWKVTAKDNRGASTTGNIWRFTTRHDTLPTQGLVAYYPFNGNANDESGNRHNATVSGAALTTDRFGIGNRACQFHGVNDSIVIPANSNLILSGSFTIALWIRPVASGRFQDIINKRKGFSCDWQLTVSQTTNGIDYNKHGCATLMSSNSIQTNVWTFVCAIYNGSDAGIYRNGILDKDSSGVSPFGASLSNVVFGSGWDGSHPFSGDLDDVRIYNRALADSEIQALYHEGGW